MKLPSPSIEMATSSWLQVFLSSKKNFLTAMHMKSLSQRLRKYGLRYDDLYDPMYDLDIKEALNRLPRAVVNSRNQRLKRAIDLSLKHQYLPEDMQARQTPFRCYLQEMLALVQRERAEQELWELCRLHSAPFLECIGCSTS